MQNCQRPAPYGNKNPSIAQRWPPFGPARNGAQSFILRGGRSYGLGLVSLIGIGADAGAEAATPPEILSS